MSADDDLPGTAGDRLAARRAASRQEALAQRQAYADRLLGTMPAAMAERAQWLVWRFMARPGATKPPKVPFYANGHLRGWPNGRPGDGKPTEARPQVPQGHELDRARLVTLDDAIEAFLRRPDWTGIGFAFLPDDGLVGIDIDHAVDEHGVPSDLCRQVVELCGSYTELSPSGRGVHIIVSGQTETFKDDAIGLEVYCNAQYFTCTGHPPGEGWPPTPTQVQAIDPDVLAYLRELVDESKKRQAAERAAAAEAANAAAQAAAPPAPTPAPPPARGAAPVAALNNDFKLVNDAAMASLHLWVPRLFADAKPWRTGYRVSSKSLSRDLQEDIAIQADGIVDWGVADLGDSREGKRTPIDLVLEWGARIGVATDKPAEAMRWLAQVLGVPLQSARPRHVPSARTPTARAAHTAASSSGLDGRGSAQQQGEGTTHASVEADADDADDAGGGTAASTGGKKKLPREVWELVDTMCDRFSLVYGTDQAWDAVELMLVRVPMMRLAFGKVPVNLWLSRPGRNMVRMQDLVFEPGAEVLPPKINMYAGLDIEPEPCEAADVAPMLQLLRHLCSETRIAGSQIPVDDAMHWVLCWQALPLQQPGTKMATAIVMHGAQGTGKNLFWDAWRDIHGSYGVTVTQTELEDKYNGWMSRKIAIVGDEVVSRQEMYHNKNRLKLIVTQGEKFAIRGMFMETRWESNHANVVFLSNESEPLVLEDRDRRYMVIYTPLEAPAELYERVRAFLQDGGLRKWLYYLQHYDLDGFQAHTKPPMTAAKEALIEASWRPAMRFAHEWLEGFIELPVRVCSAGQLYRAFRRWADQNGEKWPPPQARFTTEVQRFVRERSKRGGDGKFVPPRVVYKQIALRDDPQTARKVERCWVPTGENIGPPSGVTEGEWAAEAVRMFENDVRRFMRRPGGGSDDGADGGDD